MNPSVRRALRNWLPPAAIRTGLAALDLVRPAPFEFVGVDWPGESRAAGWNETSVAQARVRGWTRFLDSIEGTTPFGVSAEDLAHAARLNLDVQNLYVTFGFCLAGSARGRGHIRMLDWGGELGSYREVARKLLPDLELDYHCADLPAVVEIGRRLHPDITFHDDESWRDGTYDFVFSSSSLQYVPDWRSIADGLTVCATRDLFITRMPFVARGPSFVALQRAREYGTEYHGWVLNRGEFVDFVTGKGMTLVRQFVNHPGPRIKGASEPNVYMGFLFRRIPGSALSVDG